MRTGETIQPLGYIQLPDGPIELDYFNLDLDTTERELDPDKMINGQTSGIFDFAADDNPDQVIKERLGATVSFVVRWIEHNRVPGQIILRCELCSLFLDHKIRVGVYRL